MPAAIPTLKVVVAGDGNVGKTSLIRRWSEGRFESSRVMTIGVDFQTKVVELPDGEEEIARAERTIVDVVVGGLRAS